jgi:site-specific recombinase XerD
MEVQMSLAGNAFATQQKSIRGVRCLMLHYQCLPEECTADQIKAFLVHQRDKGQYSSSTVNLRVCGLKYYFREVVHRLDLVVKIPNPRVSKFNVEILTLEEIKQLRCACREKVDAA